MSKRIVQVILATTVAAFCFVPGFAAQAKEQTLTGQVGDAMCGRSHMMPGKSEVECTRACIKEGSKYALIVGDSVYTLEGKTDGLDAFAGKSATVTGTVKGQTVMVTSVAAAK